MNFVTEISYITHIINSHNQIDLYSDQVSLHVVYINTLLLPAGHFLLCLDIYCWQPSWQSNENVASVDTVTHTAGTPLTLRRKKKQFQLITVIINCIGVLLLTTQTIQNDVFYMTKTKFYAKFHINATSACILFVHN